MKKRILSLLLALVMVLSLAACGAQNDSPQTSDTNKQDAETTADETHMDVEDSDFFGPIYDEWSEMTDEELYELAKEEVKTNGPINVYATSSKMMKEEDLWLEKYPELSIDIMDLDNDEVLEKCVQEANAQNIQGDVLQVKDVNGDVFFNYYEEGFMSAFYPKDICAHIDDSLLRYGYPLYASQSFWYNTAAFPDGQPITSWWQLVEKKEDGSQKYRLFTKEIGTETAYLSLFASFIVHADQMEQAYKDLYGTDLEYTYDASGFDFDVPENNAGVEFMWRFSQLKLTFISDGDELVLAVHNASDPADPALALASAGKIENREESGYTVDWVKNLTPYTGLLNEENLYVVTGCKHPAGARLFIRFITGGADGESGGLKPFTKQGNWTVRDDVKDKKNPATLEECGAVAPDLAAIHNVFMDAQDLWIYWLSISPYTK